MNTYTVEPPTLDTLSDFFALHPDPADAAKRLPILRENLAAGRVRLENVLILHSERGVEGTVLISGPVQVPAFPRFRPDTPPEGITALAQALREKVGPERLLVLQDDQAPLNAEAVEAAGWVLDDHQALYQTDLHAHAYARDPQAREVEAHDPEIAALLDSLGRADFQLREGWTFLALSDESAQPVALGAAGPSGRPDWASVDLIGVLPGARGRGLGTRLHAYLLALAAERHSHHGGSTRADNHAMRRIYAKNGSQLVATQLYFRST